MHCCYDVGSLFGPWNSSIGGFSDIVVRQYFEKAGFFITELLLEELLYKVHVKYLEMVGWTVGLPNKFRFLWLNLLNFVFLFWKRVRNRNFRKQKDDRDKMSTNFFNSLAEDIEMYYWKIDCNSRRKEVMARRYRFICKGSPKYVFCRDKINILSTGGKQGRAVHRSG